MITEAGNDPEGRGACLHRRFCPGQGRVRGHADQGSAARRARAADPAAAGRLLFLDKAKFAASFAADVDPDKAAFMADSQVPWGVEALTARSASRHGRRSRVGIWSPPTTG